MKDILTAPFLVKTVRTITEMYRHGWDERNGGNVSLLLDEAEVREHLVFPAIVRTIPTGFEAPELDGKIFLVTGTGKYFKNVQYDPAKNLGIVRLAKNGTEAEVLQAIGEELSALAEEGISEEQTQVVKQRLKSGFIFSLESTNSRMYRLGKNMLLLGRTYTEEETLAEIDAVSREQVNAFAKRIADIRSYSGAAISPRSLDWEELWNGSQNLNGSAKRG